MGSYCCLTQLCSKMKQGPIIIVEDDAEDADIFQDILIELDVKNKMIWFTNSNDAFFYLKATTDQPFIIFCDVNLPVINGIEFKRQVDSDAELRRKSIPFVFYSTSVSQATVNEAYTQMTVQGFFQKKNTYAEVKGDIKLILNYWKDCKHPNTA
jgi:CheY-like chemotaxis protein